VTEQLPYEVVKRFDGFELRSYPEYVLAQVQVRGDFITAGNSAFNPLLRYITGNNQNRSQLAMTAPVFQTSVEPDHHLVSFALPAAVSMQIAPEPTDAKVHLVEVPTHLAVARRFSGFWSYDRFLNESETLEDAVEEAVHNGDLSGHIVGEIFVARYNSPFTPFFLRRNEVMAGFDSN
jgi:SOUL heme-binding protein